MSRKINLLLISVFILFMLGVTGCGGGQDGAAEGQISDSADGGSTETGNPVMAGLVQKGPFYGKTKVVIEELDDVYLMPTGIEHEIEVHDDLGAFAFDNTTNVSSTYVQVSATGYYYDEITGTASTQPLTLSAFVDITRTQEVNINILTTIAAKREKYLITQGKKTYEASKFQAQQEVLDVFNFTEDAIGVPLVEDMDTFIHMDIGQDGTKNGVLLSLSILLQNFQNRFRLATVSKAIDFIGTDIEADGVCDSPKYIDTLFCGADKIELFQIRTNLETYFRALAEWFTIPDFESIFENNIIPRTRMTAPIFSTPSGTYNQDISVAIYSSTRGATIYYSINGSDPEVYENPIDISGNGTVVNIKAWSDIYYRQESFEVSSYYLIDYDYDDDPSVYKMGMTIGDYQSNIVGTWVGYIVRPQQWLSPDNVKITIDETGQYTAEKLSFFIESDYPAIDINQTPAYEQRGSDFCYGTEFDFNTKTIEINEISADGKAAADLIEIGADDGTNIAGELDEIAMSDDFNHLQYKFRCNALPADTFTFYLTRLTE